MKFKSDDKLSILSQGFKRSSTLSTLLTDKTLLNNIKLNEHLDKRQAPDLKSAKALGPVFKIQTLKEVTRLGTNENLTPKVKRVEVVKKREKKMIIYRTCHDNGKEEFKTMQDKIMEIIELIENDSDEIQAKCNELWFYISSCSIAQEEEIVSTVKNAIQSSWVLLVFTTMFCYYFAQLQLKGNIEEREENIIEVKEIFMTHIQSMEEIEKNYSTELVLCEDIASFNTVLIGYNDSISKIHKTFLTCFSKQKEIPITEAWNKLPNVNYTMLTALFNLIKRPEMPLKQQQQQIQIQQQQQTQPQQLTVQQYEHQQLQELKEEQERLQKSEQEEDAETSNEEPEQSPVTLQIPIPYLPKQKDKEYTLVLDLDETLISYQENIPYSNKGIVNYRPHLISFLENIAPYYELILFTMSLKAYADPIVDRLEQDRKFFQKRLYREHSRMSNNQRIKDLSTLGRDLSTTIIVDDQENNFLLQRENGILIHPYYGKEEDIVLLDLLPILVKIAKEKMDVRQGMKIFKDDLLRNVTY